MNIKKRPASMDAAAQKVGQDGDVTIPLEGDATLQVPEVEVVDGPNAMRKAEELAFMEERLKIIVHESTDESAENPVLVAVNGRNQYMFRGVEQIVKRKFVERLARAKTKSFRQDLNNIHPSEYNRLTSHSALKYPFSIIEDGNPKGHDWLRKVLAEAA